VLLRHMLIPAAALALSLAALPGVSRADDPVPPYFIGTSTLSTSTSETDCNFNGTAVPCGDYIWFIAVGKLHTPALAPVTIYLQNQHITFTASAVNYDVQPPNSSTLFSSTATTATTSFTGTNWSTVVPVAASGNQFYAAVAWPVPCPGGLPGSVKPVAWTASFYADKPGVTVDWTWSAAAYSSFTTAYASINVKATDANAYAPNANSDHAGTPENYKTFVVGGATGGGGSNYTGSLCSTQSVPDLPVPAGNSSWGSVKAIYR